MAKTLANWKNSFGSSEGNKDKSPPTELLRILGEKARMHENGKVFWTDDLPLLLWDLEDMICYGLSIVDDDDKEIDQDDKRIIINRAISSTIKKKGPSKAIQPSSFMSSVRREVTLFLKKKEVDYVLISSLSVKKIPFKRITINGTTLSPIEKRGNKYPFPQKVLERADLLGLEQHIDSSNYQSIKIRTRGKSHFEAAAKAIEALDLLRALWTLYGTYGTSTYTLGGSRQKPIGVVHAAPIHTLHLLSSKEACDEFWFDPNYKEDYELYNPRLSWAKLENKRRLAYRKINALPEHLRKDVTSLLLRYISALDHADLNFAFTHLWGLLEKISNTVGAKYDEMIRRILWPLKDRQLYKEILRIIRIRRNQYIHSANAEGNIQRLTYFLKSFVDLHLIRLIRNDFQVESLEEYGKFLSLPTNLTVLRSQRDIANIAINIRERWEN